MALLLTSTQVRALVGKIARASVGSVTGATNATPIVITCAGHGLETGDKVAIYGVGGNTAADGVRSITKVDANSFSLQDANSGSNVAGNGSYTSGGTIQRLKVAMTPSDLEDLATTLERMNYDRGSDKDRTNESAIGTIFSV